MPNVDHSTLSDPYLHEPKGIATAQAGQIYVANGTGSGTWVEGHRLVGGYLTFSTGSPYAFSATTSDSVLNPVYSLATNNGFTGLSSPNARLRYDGSETINAVVDAVFSVTQSSGSPKALQLAFFKNGSELTGSRMIATVANGEYHVITIKFDTTLSTNNYLEVFGKVDSATTINFVSGYLRITGTPA